MELIAQLEHVSAASLTAVLIVAAAGLLMGVAPSSLPMYSVVVGSVAARTTESAGARRGLLFALGFVLGLASADALIGALFGFFGQAVITALAGKLGLMNLLIGLLLAAIGLALLRVIRVPWLRFNARPRELKSFGGAYGVGVPFGFSTCPACTPMTLPILGAAAATGSLWLGAALMFVFGLARGAPLIVAAVAADLVKLVPRFAPVIPRIEFAGGVLVLLAAFYFFYLSAFYAGLAPAVDWLLLK
ncbi:MAG: sulfite exporter TauE/SafE family protein [Betaproteobacteria bacterium]|nr:sulfite exporter TauE/SafE family protein [Betaproteobacteria bacterium]